MQNMFQIGFSLADLMPGGGQGDGAGAGWNIGQALRGITDQATSQANGQPFIAKGVEVTGAPDVLEFQAVFQTLPTSQSTFGTIRDDDRLAQLDPSLTEPSDQALNADMLFDAIESGDINIDEFIPPGSPLNSQVKAALAQRAALPSAPPVASDVPAIPNIEDVIAALETLTSTAQQGSAVQAATLRLQSQADRLSGSLNTVAGSPSAGPQLAGPPNPTPAVPTARPSLPSSTPLDAPGGAAFPDENPASSQLTAAQDRIRVALPEQARPSPTNSVTPEAAQTALSALARDLDQGRRIEARAVADERTAALDAVARDVPLPRPVATVLNSVIAPPNVPASVDPARLNLQTADADPMALEGELPLREGRGGGSLSVTSQQGMPTPMSPAQAQQVTRQIAIAIQNNANRSVEITLSPAELGRVRISLSTAEAGMVVSIQADRPETLDLMRRNAELLAGDFRDIGYDGATFSFEGSSQQGDTDAAFDEDANTSDDPVPILSMADGAAQPNPQGQTIILGDGAVDIRL